MTKAIEVEIDSNYAAFVDLLGDLLPQERGRYALLRSRKLEGIFDSPTEAEIAGYKRFGEQPYSIQQVECEPIDLGFYSYALP